MAKPTNQPNRRKATRWQDSHRNHITVLLLALALLLSACSPTTAPTIEVAVQGDLPTPTLEPTLTPTPLPTATPQPSPTATPQPGLSGRILDQATGQPVAGAKVSADAYTTTTDTDGHYALTGLPPGQYVLSVTHEGYDPSLSAILTLGQDQAVTASLELYAAGTTPYPQDPMLTNPLDPNGAPTAEEAERLARLQGLTGEVVRVEETKLLGQFLVNYRIGDDIRAAVAELQHEVWKLTDEAGQKWWIIKVCGNRASRLPAEVSIATPEPRPLPPLAEVMVDVLSVRACASETCEEVGTIQRGTRVEVFACLADGSWCQVGLPDGERGWCAGPSLRQLAVAEAVPVLETGKIAFLSDRNRKPLWADIYLMNPDGGGQTRVTTDLRLVGSGGYRPLSSGQEGRFDWSDVHRKFFYSNAWGELYSVNADGSGETLVAEKVYAFDLAPDGQHIAFPTDTPSPNYDTVIAIMNTDGTGKTVLADQATCDSLGLPEHCLPLGPAWSPDGSKIAFAASGSLAVINADSTDPVRLTSFIDAYEPLSWSPNGQYLTFQTSNKEGVFDLHFLDLHNDRTSKLVEGGSGPAWSPDGRQIAFTKGEQIWVINADGTGLTQLTFEGHNCCPVWVRFPTPTPTPPPSPSAMATVEPVSTLPAKPTRPATPAAVSPPKRLTFYYFYAKWCNYSQQMTPIIKQLDADYKDRMDFTWLNVDKTSSDYWCYKYGI